ncbi:MAG: methyltransferase domain-containing protein [Chloroflexota bacterium]
MDRDHEQHHEYDDQFVAGLEWIWGEGFLSPGGADEVALILDGLDLDGKRVLDIGCGIGGIDILLVKKHNAAQVVGVDVEQPLLDRAMQLVQQAGLTDRINFQLIQPGPLPFADESFDFVFSKDAMVHIPDKVAIYSEIYRVLQPDGQVAFSDWFGSEMPNTPEFEEWLRVISLTFGMGTLAEAERLMDSTGFRDITTNDRNAWYADYMHQELETIQGENYDRLVAEHGEAMAAQRLQSSLAKKTVVDQGLLRPGHIRAIKP